MFAEKFSVSGREWMHPIAYITIHLHSNEKNLFIPALEISFSLSPNLKHIPISFKI